MAVVAPQKTPKDFGFKKGDYHLIANYYSGSLKAFDFNGKMLWEVNCLLEGQHPNWSQARGDTPPGLYKLGDKYDDYSNYGDNPPYNHDVMAYGWGFFQLIDLEGVETRNDRDGVGLHGGGTGLGFPGCWAERQQLLYTWGCCRVYNYDWFHKIAPLKTETNDVYFSVFQHDI